MSIARLSKIIPRLITLLSILYLVIQSVKVYGMAIPPRESPSNSTSSTNPGFNIQDPAPVNIPELLYSQKIKKYQNVSKLKLRNEPSHLEGNINQSSQLRRVQNTDGSSPNEPFNNRYSGHSFIAAISPTEETYRVLNQTVAISRSVSRPMSNSSRIYGNGSSLRNSWQWLQSNGNAAEESTDSLVKSNKRQKRQTAQGTLDEMCRILPRDDILVKPLRCYQCKSSTKDRDPQCDNRLFRFLRHSEKFILRKRCTIDKGDYCMKTVKRKFGERITERGCFPGPVIGPNGKELKSREGCFTYPKDGYQTTTCFCKSDDCNSAPLRSPSGTACLVAVIFTAFKQYGVLNG